MCTILSKFIGHLPNLCGGNMLPPTGLLHSSRGTQQYSCTAMRGSIKWALNYFKTWVFKRLFKICYQSHFSWIGEKHPPWILTRIIPKWAIQYFRTIFDLRSMTVWFWERGLNVFNTSSIGLWCMQWLFNPVMNLVPWTLCTFFQIVHDNMTCSLQWYELFPFSHFSKIHTQINQSRV